MIRAAASAARMPAFCLANSTIAARASEKPFSGTPMIDGLAAEKRHLDFHRGLALQRVHDRVAAGNPDKAADAITMVKGQVSGT